MTIAQDSTTGGDIQNSSTNPALSRVNDRVRRMRETHAEMIIFVSDLKRRGLVKENEEVEFFVRQSGDFSFSNTLQFDDLMIDIHPRFVRENNRVVPATSLQIDNVENLVTKLRHGGLEAGSRQFFAVQCLGCYVMTHRQGKPITGLQIASCEGDQKPTDQKINERVIDINDLLEQADLGLWLHSSCGADGSPSFLWRYRLVQIKK